ncbi:ParB N-terminal domain-containing protein [Hymenobacter glacieicola]|uniref:ParB-like N-terminal domain-containing protein n=1 Tax=Hymenobacter glacieicola TaxID=1562124 RepID=A0ABQ1WMW7_9BACT|nr:ParB N-terminal domain-containing protein [Hymenobacter glacieicola]GGG34059.1 hypothetical protein GCM10011378_08100 [Hymenobacter glacieicola]
MPNTHIVPIEQVKLHPHNPRLIKDNRFEQLVQSLIDFPDMLHVRPLVVDEDYFVLGGNMRLHAALRLSYKEVPVLQITNWTEAQKREFMIKDNASFGEWNWEVLANEWSENPLGAWGIDLPEDWLSPPDEQEEATSSGSGSGDSPDSSLDDEQEYTPGPRMTITFPSAEDLQHAEADVQELLDRKYPGASFTVQVGERNG